ncbi:MAG TPA: SDR family NAD(P)-dependent oxidoreductase [Actinomycetes bacterium]|nr:SDR family NAD(P)-dependent oxidoreductase [Actinomycetes bacterium]
MGLLADRVAIVTGSGQGIGRATALLFSQQGARVVIADIRDDTRAETLRQVTEQGGDGIAVRADVTDPRAATDLAAAAMDAYGRIDVLVNNAGTSWGSTGLDVTEDDWNGIVALNLTGQFNCVRAVVPHMKHRRYGKLVGIASDAGRFLSYGAGLPYVAAKAGVHGMYRRLAEELGGWNITANVISPGNVLTEEGKEYMKMPSMRGLVRDCPMGRWTEPEELASAVLFFASDLSSHVTGSTVSVNGGWHMLW